MGKGNEGFFEEVTLTREEGPALWHGSGRQRGYVQPRAGDARDRPAMQGRGAQGGAGSLL